MRQAPRERERGQGGRHKSQINNEKQGGQKDERRAAQKREAKRSEEARSEDKSRARDDTERRQGPDTIGRAATGRGHTEVSGCFAF